MTRTKKRDTGPIEKAHRAKEWLKFRKDNLITQVRMSELSGVSRRTIQMIEAGRLIPHFSTQQRFLDLKKRLSSNEKVA